MRNEIKVGIFALVGLVLFCLSIVLLGGDKLFLTRTYPLKLRMAQVQGLARGSVVTLTGVSVGNIDDIRFVDKSNDVEVIMTIEAAVQRRITSGSTATVKTQGALGDKFVFIHPGPPENPPIPSGGVIELDRTPDLFDVIATKGGDIGQIADVIKEVRLLVESLNRDGRPGKLMANLVSGSAELRPALADIRETLRLVRGEAITPLTSILKKIDNGQGTLGALINDPSLHNRISAFLGEAPRNRFLKPLLRESIQINEKNK